MKKINLLIFLNVLSFIVLGQKQFFSFGLNTAHLESKRVEEILSAYNSNSWISEPLRGAENLTGLVLSSTRRSDNMAITLGFMFRTDKSDSYGAIANDFEKRTLKQKFNGLYGDIYWLLLDKDRFKTGPGIGLSFSYWRIFQSIEGTLTPHTTDKFEPYFSRLLLMLQLSWDINLYIGDNFSFDIIPYYHIPFGRPQPFNFNTLQSSLGVTGLPVYNKYNMKYIPMVGGISFAISFSKKD